MNSINLLAGNTNTFTKVVEPIVELLNAFVGPLLLIVMSIGTIYCIILGLKFAKAEEPQEREKTKVHLKNAIIGFLLIFILIVALNLAKKPLIDWVNSNGGSITY